MEDSELDLIVRAKAGDHAAQTNLMNKHKGMIHKWAHYYHRKRPGSSFDDFIQEGRMGLLHAVDGFNASRGVKFITFAEPWIRNYVQKTDGGGAIYIPTNAYKRASTAKYVQPAHNAASIDCAKDDDRPFELEDKDADDPLDVEYDAEDVEMLRVAIAGLENPRHRRIVVSRLFDGAILAKLGKEFGVCRERVRQLEIHAIEKIKESIMRQKAAYKRAADDARNRRNERPPAPMEKPSPTARNEKPPIAIGATVKNVKLRAPALTTEQLAAVRIHYDAGFGDAAIGELMGLTVHRIRRWRQINGLKDNRGSEASRQKRMQHYKVNNGQHKAARMKMWKAQKDKAAAMGWPQVDTPRQAKIMAFLATGPKTKEQIAVHIGVKPVTCRLTANGLPIKTFVVSTLMRMINRGLIQNVGSAKVGGRKNRTSLFALTEAIAC